MDVLKDSDAAALHAASVIAREARAAIAGRDRFVLALSGGTTPRRMLQFLAVEDLPWEKVRMVQVDERIAPMDFGERNLALFQDTLPLPEHLYPMPVDAEDPVAAARDYTHTLERLAGAPPVIDLVQLGLGADGHTASLAPNDPVLGITDAEVAVTDDYRGRRRMTLTYPAINRARRVLWLVTGEAKSGMLSRLGDGDTAIPAGRVNRDRATVVADEAAAGR